MPWLVGDEREWRVLGTASSGLAVADILSTGTYTGYLLDGFDAALHQGAFRTERPPLAFRAGWKALAVTARTDDSDLAAALGPYLAPTAPRPHRSAPLGFTLFSTEWLRTRLGKDTSDSTAVLRSLDWAVRLQTLVGQRSPVFCDPILELALEGRSAEETAACRFRPVGALGGLSSAMQALFLGRLTNAEIAE